MKKIINRKTYNMETSEYTEETIVPLTAAEMKAWKKENNR